jgi:hypothetical protein
LRKDKVKDVLRGTGKKHMVPRAIGPFLNCIRVAQKY